MSVTLRLVQVVPQFFTTVVQRLTNFLTGIQRQRQGFKSKQFRRTIGKTLRSSAETPITRTVRYLLETENTRGKISVDAGHPKDSLRRSITQSNTAASSEWPIVR
jgi:hypothetical protein